MKRLLVILLVSSILLTQCYTQNEYLARDYDLVEGEKIDKIIKTDSTEFTANNFDRYISVLSDSLLVLKEVIDVKKGDYTTISYTTDSLRIDKIHSVFLSELNMGATVFLSIIGGGLLALIIGVAISGSPAPSGSFKIL